MSNYKISLILVASCAALLSACESRRQPQISSSGSSQSNGAADQSGRSANADIRVTESMLAAAKVRVQPVMQKSVRDRIETTGEIKADEERVFHVNSLVSAKLATDLVTLGQHVRENQKLAMVENLEVMRICSGYIHETHQKELEIKQCEVRLKLARANKERLQKLTEERIAAEKDYLQAQAQLVIEENNLDKLKHEQEHQRAEASALLRAYGVDLNDLKGEEPLRYSPVLSPRAGVVVKKNVTVGDVVNPSDPLYVVSDLSRVWLDITVFDRDIGKVETGSSVTFTSDALPNSQFHGRIDYIRPLAQDGRTFLARSSLNNPRLILKPGMFGQVVIEGGSPRVRVFVPSSAMQTVQGKRVVFLEKSPGCFHRIEVDAEPFSGGFIIRKGLNPGDRIAVEGAYYLREEMQSRREGGS